MINKIARFLFGSANERFVKKQFKIVEKNKRFRAFFR